ncbi:L,D-transpeptidase [Cohnella terricola]|uniref:L,D-transpeptidase n=1 Tax=Cohnella terricola TaxID=1289167 RepID=A0A559JW81_9BACL|nr:L,D-transpeptidase [Cohnella terricola]TVY04139.1 L,D-transpeptidase [Cohnella terricola]
MSKESRIDEQIQHFYDNVPDVGDALPLKEYLLKHEDSRMAWYLLGKEYEGKGDTAKATYCFAQAGEIYEAFESKPAPQLPNSKEKSKKSWLKRILLLLIPLFLVAGAILAVREFVLKDEPVAQEEPVKEASVSPSPDGVVATKPGNAGKPAALPSGAIPPDLVAGASGPDDAGRSELGALLTKKPSRQPRILIVSPRLGKWSDWVKSGKPIASATSDKESGTAGIQWFDSKWCDCKPDDGKAVQKLVQGWKPMQEQKIALRSAMIRYKEMTGKWPSSPESLAGDYPANTMAGWTENMTPWFDELKAVLEDRKDGKIPKAPVWPDSTGPEAGHGSPSGQLSSLAEQPLEVIVDKSNHRLAIVSGSVILRNYEVGLGGDKTPEGKFAITEKVKDPNGRSNGAFGSRGMTLSDSRYGIHGTDEPKSIGKDESLGCVRMKKEDIEELYDLVPMGTPVTIAKGGLPNELRAPPERFKLPSTQDETNPHKVYDWLG